MCTDTGVKHQYKNGRLMRYHLQDFISDKYDPDEVYVQTSYKTRTIESARAQLDGLYGESLSWPKVNKEFELNTIPNEEDYILHLTHSSCPRLDQIQKAMKADSEAVFLQKQIDDDLESTLFPELRKLTGKTDADTEEMHNVCNYIMWMHTNNRKLKFDLTDEQFRQCEVSSNRKIFSKWNANEELSTLPAFNLAQTLSDIASVADGKMKLLESKTFMHYYDMWSGHKMGKEPKFFLFSAHAETVGPLLRFYNMMDDFPLEPAPSSMLVFDFI